jgi:hypothetical protein
MRFSVTVYTAVHGVLENVTAHIHQGVLLTVRAYFFPIRLRLGPVRFYNIILTGREKKNNKEIPVNKIKPIIMHNIFIDTRTKRLRRKKKIRKNTVKASIWTQIRRKLIRYVPVVDRAWFSSVQGATRSTHKHAHTKNIDWSIGKRQLSILRMNRNRTFRRNCIEINKLNKTYRVGFALNLSCHASADPCVWTSILCTVFHVLQRA